VQVDDGPHVVYADANGNLNQIWYTIQGSAKHAQGWAAGSLMNVPNTVALGPGSPMTSWVQADGPHVVYADANGDLYQIWYTIQASANHAQGWAAQTLMNVPNAVAVGPGMPMTSWIQSDGPHVAYADANGNVYQLWYTEKTGQWAAQSLMTVPNVLPVGSGSAMTSWVQANDGPHIVYTDVIGHVRQLYYAIATNQWAAQDLSGVP
jgi:hypothetical protein